MIIVRHAEIYTKAEPTRSLFIKRLSANIQRVLPEHKVSNRHWRIHVYGEEEAALNALGKVFGISSFSPAHEIKADISTIKEKAVKLAEKGKTFAVRTQRLDKSFPLTSPEMNRVIGAEIVEKKGLKVNLEKPEQVIGAEIFKGKAHVFSRTIRGPGGLPYGTAGGKVLCLAEDWKGVLSSWMMMKRGVEVILSCPESLDRTLAQEWSSGKKIKTIPSGDPLEQAKNNNAMAIVLPSTREGITGSFSYFNKGYPVFLPLSAYDEKQAEELMQKILN